MSEHLKKRAAEAALDQISTRMVLGVGTGSTVDHLIALLPSVRGKLEACVASSRRTEEALKQHGLPVVDLNDVGACDLYIDGADECTDERRLIKGGGGALTREKVCAQAAKRFICVIDGSKRVSVLGDFPVPIEVIEMARSSVARQLVSQYGVSPAYRRGFVTDNGHHILDVTGFKITDAVMLEQSLNQIAGVVTNGVFACRPADQVICAQTEGITVF